MFSENNIFYTIMLTIVHNLKGKLNGANKSPNKVCGWVSGSPVNNQNTMCNIEGISLGQPT